jgi:trigger factor
LFFCLRHYIAVLNPISQKGKLSKEHTFPEESIHVKTSISETRISTMEIVKENTGPLEATITMKVNEADYLEPVDKELKNLQKKMQEPGFRPGKVPIGLVKKKYGRSVVLEEVNKLQADKLFEYIKKEELNVLGNPMLDQAASDISEDADQKDFEFVYHIGLAPEIDLELSQDIDVDYHKITVEDQKVEDYVNEIRKRHGDYMNPGVSEEDDVLFGEFAELDEGGKPIEGGVTNKTNVYIHFLNDEDTKKELIGAKPGSAITMDVLKAVGAESEAAAMLGIKKEELSEHNSKYRFTVESISRIKPADLNEEFFEKALPGMDIKTEDAFRETLANQISDQYQADVDKHFRNLVSEKLIEITKLPLPESFLKKWLLDNNKEKLSEAQVDEEFEKAADAFRWQLIENHLIKAHELEVSPEEVKKQLEFFIRTQLAQYGQADIPQEIVDKYVQELGGKQEEVKKVYDHLYDAKLMKVFKEKLKLNEIEVSMEDFEKIVKEKYNKDEVADDAQNESKTE